MSKKLEVDIQLVGGFLANLGAVMALWAMRGVWIKGALAAMGALSAQGLTKERWPEEAKKP